MTDNERIPTAWLTRATASIFEAVGIAPAAAHTVAGALVDADLRGISSHGTMLVPMYVDRLLAGSVSTADQARVIRDEGAVAMLDGVHALGVLTADQAMTLAVAKAREYGVGVVTVRHAFHFGGAFRYVQTAARQGCIGIAAANTRPLMPAPGGAAPVVGNNPLAIGVPEAGGEPVVLDMALSEAALGKIRLAAQEGRSIPATWATGPDGEPTTDPAAAVAGMLLPTGGHKGYGLALMVDVLTGVLSAGAFGSHVKGLYADVSVPNDCSLFMLALDVDRFGGLPTFTASLADLAKQATGSARAPGVERLLLPGQLESERHAAGLRDGVQIDRGVLEALAGAAERVGVQLDPWSGAA